MLALFLAAASLAIWLYLLIGRGGFWLSAERDDAPLPPYAGTVWPTVTVVIPARDEAEGIGACIGSLVAQDYKGDCRVILVDDGSTDGTAALARQAALDAGAADRLEIISGRPL